MVMRLKWGLFLACMALRSVVTTGSFESDTKINLIQLDGGWSLDNQISDDTVRADPLDRLRKYRGGYDVTNKHYWSSTIFTGIHGYVIGLLWLVTGVLLGGLLIASSCITSHKKNYNTENKHELNFKQHRRVSLILAAVLTIVAITAAGVVLGENAQFYARAKKVENIITKTADKASGTLYEATEALNSISKSMEGSKYLITNPSLIRSTSEELDSAAATILIQTKKNRRLINNVLKISFVTATVIIALTLVAVIALSISELLHFKKIISKLIAICWVLTFLCWVLFGVYFSAYNFAKDTCIALEDFQKDPYNNTLSSLLPCKNMLPAKSALSNVGGQINTLVQEVNANLLLMRITNFSYTIQVCDPFSGPPEYSYQPDNCPTGTIHIGDIPKVLKQLTCSSTKAGNCTNVLSNNSLKIIQEYAISIQTLLNAFPDMESLVECQTIKDAFTEIISEHCTPLKRSVKFLWTATLLLSIVMMILIVTWVGKAYNDHNHHFLDIIGKPQNNPSTKNTLESG